jgi:hypothetical protein
MRLYAYITRMSFLAALVIGSAVGGGWKWDSLPH